MRSSTLCPQTRLLFFHFEGLSYKPFSGRERVKTSYVPIPEGKSLLHSFRASEINAWTSDAEQARPTEGRPVPDGSQERGRLNKELRSVATREMRRQAEPRG